MIDKLLEKLSLIENNLIDDHSSKIDNVEYYKKTIDEKIKSYNDKLSKIINNIAIDLLDNIDINTLRNIKHSDYSIIIKVKFTLKSNSNL